MTTNAIELERKIVNRNPATGEVVSEHAAANAAEVHAAVSRARAAQTDWNALGIARRVDVLRKFQSLLVAEREVVASRITAECGKPLAEALLSELLVALDAARFCSENVHRALSSEDVPHGNLIMKLKRGRLVY